MGKQSAQAEGGQIIHAVGKQQQEGKQSAGLSAFLFHSAGGGIAAECAVSKLYRIQDVKSGLQTRSQSASDQAQREGGCPTRINGRSLGIGGLQDEIDFSNTTLVGLGDGDLDVVDHKSLTRLGDSAQVLHHVAAHGG